MARLSLFLPPPAGDYSGAAGVLFGLDCLVVLVDAGCCTRNYTEYDEPRWARRRKTAFSAQLRTLEAVLGDEERIVEQTAEGVHELGVSCAALLGTPVPAVTGMNLPGIACDVEARAGAPALGIETCGFETYERGASRAFKALVSRFARTSEATAARDEVAPLRVNVLGLTAQDFMGEADMQACLGWLQEAGLEIAFSSAGSYTLDDVIAAGQADASVAVAWSGLAAAHELQQRCGVSYVVGRPWCAEDARVLAELVRKGCIACKSTRKVGVQRAGGCLVGQHRGAAAGKGGDPLEKGIADPGESGVLMCPSDEFAFADLGEVPRFGKRGVCGESRGYDDRGRKACLG